MHHQNAAMRLKSAHSGGCSALRIAHHFSALHHYCMKNLSNARRTRKLAGQNDRH
jgi:hypothetical protein